MLTTETLNEANQVRNYSYLPIGMASFSSAVHSDETLLPMAHNMVIHLRTLTQNGR